MNGEYNTKQKQILIDFLQSNLNRQLSIKQVAEGVGSSGIGESTVYRHMGRLCEEGIIRRFRGEDGKRVVYQYIGENSHCDSHFHLKCTSCGKLVHLDCHQIMSIKDHIMHEHDFNIDLTHTVLYGICGVCRERQGK